ncbi:TOBE domain-containing protein, partial [Atopococcus tabaci]|uniref:TOBE domain-containing protein n=1 Tax=Atopococcus tabaci TaxID=269774 RepID=UPI002409ED1C
QEVYDYPANTFVGGFIGSPAMNFFDVTLDGRHITNGNGLTIEIPEGKLKTLREKGYGDNSKLTFGIRPEDIHSESIALSTYPGSIVNAKVVVSELLGAETMLYSQVGDFEFIARVDARDYHRPGEEIQLAFNMSKSHFFDPETTEVIR